MNWRIIKEFFIDIFLFTIFYYTSITLILIYSYLNNENEIDVIYPILLSSFLYLIFLIVKFIPYYHYASQLHQIKDGMQGKEKDDAGFEHQQRNAIHYMKALKRENVVREHQIRTQNDEKNKIISHIVHNIKTPSSVIDLMIQQFRANEGDITELLGKIVKENSEINENLNQILNYLRSEYFANDYKIEVVDLISLIRDKINNKRESFIQNEVYPKIKTNLQKVLVLTDKKWNGILIDQIISNAIKYKKPNTDGTVTFKIERKEDKVLLVIEDDGLGITSSDLKRVFEPYFTGENGRRVKSASGIGLYICQNIARELNQKIEITSKIGDGTKVKIVYLTKL